MQPPFFSALHALAIDDGGGRAGFSFALLPTRQKNHFSSRKFDRAHVPDDLFGDAYEYLISTFASKAGKSSGEFYTPKAVSYLMSEIIEPQEQHEVCDWASGSASPLLQCREYLRRHRKDPNRLFLHAQESNVATYNISRINLILHGVNSWHPVQGDSLRAPKHVTSDNKIKQFDRLTALSLFNTPYCSSRPATLRIERVVIYSAAI
jgi:type I restriction-modification system DNA methylase subunit